MAAEERVTVKTTVPRYQKEAWAEHADELDMTQSEFVRTMVQAGRRGFDLDPPEGGSADATPGVDGLKNRVLEALSPGEPRQFDTIVDAVAADIESKVDNILQSLDAEGRVEFSNVDGYMLAEGHHGDD